jgi:hypothetical protein
MEEEAQRVVAREGWEQHPERKSDVGIRHKVMRSLKINVGDDVFNALTSTHENVQSGWGGGPAGSC